MQVRIIQCSDAGKWYDGMVGEVFEVDQNYYLDSSPDGIKRFQLLTGLSWTNASILKSDCELVEEPKNILLRGDTVDWKDALFVLGNGKKYRLVEETEPTPPKHIELNTFEDCWQKICPVYQIDSLGCICNHETVDAESYKYNYHFLPSSKSAHQILAAIKLFVIQHALNGEEFSPTPGQGGYTVYYNTEEGLQAHGSNFNSKHYVHHNPYKFITMEAAIKSIKIGKYIWLEYLGIEH